MSGLLPALSVGAQVANLLGTAQCSIGSVKLAAFEIPAEMPWGTTQKLAVHEMPGGARVIDAMGAFDVPHRWSGQFYGPSGVSRARQLDQIARAGQPVTLQWASFTYQVVVRSFECRYTQIGAWLPYTVTVESVPSKPTPPTPTFLGQMISDVTSALGISSLVNTADTYLSQAQTAITAVQSALPVVGALTAGSAAFVSVAGAVGAASGVIGAASSTVGNVISNFGSGALASGVAPATAAATVNQMATATGEAAGLSAQGAYVSRMNANMTQVGG
jgi:hypothetical protein